MNNDGQRSFRRRSEPPAAFVMFDSSGSQLRAASPARNRGSCSQKGNTKMRKTLMAAAAAAAIATPAFADGPYVGIEGGVTFPRSTDLDIILNNTSATPPTTTTYDNGFKAK